MRYRFFEKFTSHEGDKILKINAINNLKTHIQVTWTVKQIFNSKDSFGYNLFTSKRYRKASLAKNNKLEHV